MGIPNSLGNIYIAKKLITHYCTVENEVNCMQCSDGYCLVFDKSCSRLDSTVTSKKAKGTD